jgi:hypothetical protein
MLVRVMKSRKNADFIVIIVSEPGLMVMMPCSLRIAINEPQAAIVLSCKFFNIREDRK